MIKARIGGKEVPLVLTVAGLDQIDQKCGGMEGIPGFVFDKAHTAENTLWLLELLIREGEANRQVELLLAGDRAEPAVIPSAENLLHSVTPVMLADLRKTCMDAVMESIRQEVKADNSKNGNHAEQ